MTLSSTTESRAIVLWDVRDNEFIGNEGTVCNAGFSIERLFDGSDDYFGYDFEYVGSIIKTKHASVYYDEHHGKAPSTFIEFGELKEIDTSLADKTLYVVPVVDALSGAVIKEIGGDKVEAWFKSEDPFMAVFMGLHDYCGNDPDKYIF